MLHRLLSLDDEAARDRPVAGSKAAALSRARALGSPVLPGWVVPADEAASAVTMGAGLIRRGSPEACAAISTLELDGGFVDELRRVADERVGTWIVRSSSMQECDRRWAGGLSTYHDIASGGVPNAVRACWASAFTREAVRRREELGERSHDVRIAVLIQPWLPFDLGGAAILAESGTVSVSWVRGGPAGLMGGSRRGAVIELDEHGRQTTETASGLAPILAKVAVILRAVSDAGLGDAIEWGARGGEVLLLQVDRSNRHAVRPPVIREVSRAIKGSPVARRIALAASLFPGPLGEEVVLPWAAAPGADLSATPRRLTDPADALREALMLGERLALEAWGGSRNVIAGEIAATFRTLLGPQPERALDRLGQLHPVDGALSHRAVSLLQAIAPPIPPGPDRWEPFVFDVARSNGSVAQGTPISGAIGAGWMCTPGPRHVERIAPRRVLVLRDPVPQAAPLLWGSAGLVTANGTIGAHLFEVARSLGVPAVAGVDLMDQQEPCVIAIDGYRGDVTVWTPTGIVAAQGTLIA
jgi:phosphohistidine swiveling domain-containing protein